MRRSAGRRTRSDTCSNALPDPGGLARTRAALRVYRKERLPPFDVIPDLGRENDPHSGIDGIPLALASGTQ